jgi:hypothetical protein
MESSAFHSISGLWRTYRQRIARESRTFYFILNVRSLQVRAALGRRNWSSLYADLPFEQLETTAPNVAVVYFLNGSCHLNANGLHQDIVYVGQAAGRAVQKDGEGRGAAKRLDNNGRIIGRLRVAKVSSTKIQPQCYEGRREDQREVQGDNKKRKDRKSGRLHVHGRLSHEDISEVFYCILSVLPPLTDNASLCIIAIPYSTWQRPSTWYSWTLSVPRKVNPTQGSTGV